ncbi:photosynthetic NDH subunit of lumenal location 4, chloroplastic [Euphorbia lathyris]|uniref:photosynthetic NDH subunit of lumenal location 4, chloroplastic n=1 Tax=Euphorbia lathyris TaxID=212925 RepID=UPI0033139354
MAFSASAISSPTNLFTIHTPTSRSKPPFSCLSCSSLDKHPNLSSNSFSTTKKRILNVGLGLLAASFLTFAPLEANATRIEYYATVADPLCDFNFVRSGLGYCDLSAGSGVEAPYGELINVHYTARFADGRVFDSSYKRGRPLTMRIGVGKVIRGLDQGIFGGEGVPPMQVGGKRKLQIPPQLAYGPEPAGCFSGDCNIPGNATLVYDINFVGIYSGNRKQ